MADAPVISDKVQTLNSDHESGWNALATIRSTWSDKERLLIGRIADQYSRKTSRSHVTDSHLSTLAWERQMRVCSQLPSGKFYPNTKQDNVKDDLLNLVFFKYVVPHADSQFDSLTKIRMSGVYASTYGVQFMMYDYRVDDDYIGPDFWLIPARNVIPQLGRNSIKDCDWVDISTTQNKSYFQNIIDRKSKTWNTANLKKLIKLVQDGANPSRDLKADKKSAIENTRTQGANQVSSTARIEVVTRYEKGKKGHWITWCPDYPDAGVLRDIENPHKSGRIPVVARYCFPLLDSIWGLGDFERGITMQKAKDSLINLYLEAIKMSVFPPLKINETLVTSSTIKNEAGARWIMKDLNAVQAHNPSPLGVNEFTSTYQFMTTALMNQFGTTNTTSTVDKAGNEAFGKTPEAIKERKDTESSRDSWDRYMLEEAIGDLYDGMANLLCVNQEKPINFALYQEDYEALCEQYDDDDDENKGIFRKLDGKDKNSTVKVVVTKAMLPSECSFVVDAGSSLQNDSDEQNQAITSILGVYMPQMQMWDQLLQQAGKKLDAVNLLQKYVQNSGISDPEEIIEDLSDDDMAQMQQQQMQQQMMQAQPGQQAQPGMPQQGMPAGPPDQTSALQGVTQSALQHVDMGGDPQEAMQAILQGGQPNPSTMQATRQMFGGQQ